MPEKRLFGLARSACLKKIQYLFSLQTDKHMHTCVYTYIHRERERNAQTRFLFIYTYVFASTVRIPPLPSPLQIWPYRTQKSRHKNTGRWPQARKVSPSPSLLKNPFMPSKQQSEHKNLRMDLREIKLSPPTVCLRASQAVLTVLNGFSRFVYLCVLLRRVLFNNAGCGARCKSGRSSGAPPLPGVEELPARLRPRDGEPLPAASGRSARGGFSRDRGSPVLRGKLRGRQAPEADGHPSPRACWPEPSLRAPTTAPLLPGHSQPSRGAERPAGGCRAASPRPGSAGVVRGRGRRGRARQGGAAPR